MESKVSRASQRAPAAILRFADDVIEGRLRDTRDVKLAAEETVEILKSEERISHAEYSATIRHLWEYCRLCERLSKDMQRILRRAVKASYPKGKPALKLWCNDCSIKRGKIAWHLFPLRTFKNGSGFGFGPYCIACKNRRLRKARALVAKSAEQDVETNVKELAGAIVDRGPTPLLNAICSKFLAEESEGGGE